MKRESVDSHALRVDCWDAIQNAADKLDAQDAEIELLREALRLIQQSAQLYGPERLTTIGTIHSLARAALARPAPRYYTGVGS